MGRSHEKLLFLRGCVIFAGRSANPGPCVATNRAPSENLVRYSIKHARSSLPNSANTTGIVLVNCMFVEMCRVILPRIFLSVSQFPNRRAAVGRGADGGRRTQLHLVQINYLVSEPVPNPIIAAQSDHPGSTRDPVGLDLENCAGLRRQTMGMSMCLGKRRTLRFSCRLHWRAVPALGTEWQTDPEPAPGRSENRWNIRLQKGRPGSEHRSPCVDS